MLTTIQNYIPRDLSDANNKLEGLNNLANQYVVAPIAGFGLGGFKFSGFKQYKGELKSTITDNYNEKNIALHDNIALEPELFTLTGLVGETEFRYKTNTPSSIKKLAERAVTIAGYLPIISSTMRNLQNAISAPKDGALDWVDAGLGSAIDLFQTYQRLNPPDSLQAKAYNYFLALRNARVPISFDTPYGFKGNYAILSVIMTQTPYTETASEVDIVLKELRFATTETVKFDINKYSTRPAQQNSPVQNQGTVSGRALDAERFDQIITSSYGL